MTQPRGRIPLRSYFEHALRSVQLDWLFLTQGPWALSESLWFVFLKYFLIIKHSFVPFVFGKSYVTFLGRPLFYNSPLGLADFQASVVHHGALSKLLSLRNKPVFVDIGANVGFFTIVLKKLFPQSRIHCFEPLPAIFRLLQIHVNHLSDVNVLMMGVGNLTGQSRMALDLTDTYQSRISPDGNFEVKTVRLDEVDTIKREAQIDLLKIDVEGHELQVLEAATVALTKTRYLLIEIITSDPRTVFAEVIAKLHNPPYFSFTIRGMHNFDKSRYAVSGADYLLENIFFKGDSIERKNEASFNT